MPGRGGPSHNAGRYLHGRVEGVTAFSSGIHCLLRVGGKSFLNERLCRLYRGEREKGGLVLPLKGGQPNRELKWVGCISRQFKKGGGLAGRTDRVWGNVGKDQVNARFQPWSKTCRYCAGIVVGEFMGLVSEGLPEKVPSLPTRCRRSGGSNPLTV